MAETVADEGLPRKVMHAGGAHGHNRLLHSSVHGVHVEGRVHRPGKVLLERLLQVQEGHVQLRDNHVRLPGSALEVGKVQCTPIPHLHNTNSIQMTRIAIAKLIQAASCSQRYPTLTVHPERKDAAVKAVCGSKFLFNRGVRGSLWRQ